jgi:hypothetical protein
MNTREHRTKERDVPLEEVRREAYKLWQQEGCPSGRELDHWLAAKELVKHRPAPTKSDPEVEPSIRPTEALVESR